MRGFVPENYTCSFYFDKIFNLRADLLLLGVRMVTILSQLYSLSQISQIQPILSLLWSVVTRKAPEKSFLFFVFLHNGLVTFMCTSNFTDLTHSVCTV